MLQFCQKLLRVPSTINAHRTDESNVTHQTCVNAIHLEAKFIPLCEFVTAARKKQKLRAQNLHTKTQTAEPISVLNFGTNFRTKTEHGKWFHRATFPCSLEITFSSKKWIYRNIPLITKPLFVTLFRANSEHGKWFQNWARKMIPWNKFPCSFRARKMLPNQAPENDSAVPRLCVQTQTTFHTKPCTSFCVFLFIQTCQKRSIATLKFANKRCVSKTKSTTATTHKKHCS